MNTQEFTLPGGYIDAQGQVHKTVILDALGGREEELLAEQHDASAMLVTELLTRCVKQIGSIGPMTHDIARALLVADREFILLMLRQLTFGDKVEATLPCPWPDCHQNIDIDFAISSIPITGLSDIAPYYECDLQDEITQANTKIQFRLPNGADLEYLATQQNTNQAKVISQLLQRCISCLGDLLSPSLDDIQDLPANTRAKIEQAMESIAPNLDLTMELTCPECKRSFIAPFELQDFFFGELRTHIDLLYREIHYLAFHYHWSEEELMRMPRRRRRQYIRVLSEEIESMNDALN